MVLRLVGKFIGLATYSSRLDLILKLYRYIRSVRDNDYYRLHIVPHGSHITYIVYILPNKIEVYLTRDDLVLNPKIETLMRVSNEGFIEIYKIGNAEYEIDKETWERLTLVQHSITQETKLELDSHELLKHLLQNINKELDLGRKLEISRELSELLRDPAFIARILLNSKYSITDHSIFDPSELISLINSMILENTKIGIKIQFRLAEYDYNIWIYRDKNKLGIRIYKDNNSFDLRNIDEIINLIELIFTSEKPIRLKIFRYFIKY